MSLFSGYLKMKQSSLSLMTKKKRRLTIQQDFPSWRKRCISLKTFIISKLTTTVLNEYHKFFCECVLFFEGDKKAIWKPQKYLIFRILIYKPDTQSIIKPLGDCDSLPLLCCIMVLCLRQKQITQWRVTQLWRSLSYKRGSWANHRGEITSTGKFKTTFRTLSRKLY